MGLLQKHIFIKGLCLAIILLFNAKGNRVFAQYGINDTIVHTAVVYEGDTIEAKTLENLFLYSHVSAANMSAKAKWNRLRNAVYVTYPYARRAGAVLNDMNAKMATMNDKSARKDYIKSREKELRKE